jgi:hypothetical protein
MTCALFDLDGLDDLEVAPALEAGGGAILKPLHELEATGLGEPGTLCDGLTGPKEDLGVFDSLLTRFVSEGLDGSSSSAFDVTPPSGPLRTGSRPKVRSCCFSYAWTREFSRSSNTAVHGAELKSPASRSISSVAVASVGSRHKDCLRDCHLSHRCVVCPVPTVAMLKPRMRFSILCTPITSGFIHVLYEQLRRPYLRKKTLLFNPINRRFASLTAVRHAIRLEALPNATSIEWLFSLHLLSPSPASLAAVAVGSKLFGASSPIRWLRHPEIANILVRSGHGTCGAAQNSPLVSFSSLTLLASSLYTDCEILRPCIHSGGRILHT